MAEKREKDGRVGRVVIIAFVVAILAAIAWVIIEQSGVIPGDTGEGPPGTIVSE